jgi:putative Mn2+ efflux pump MntP
MKKWIQWGGVAASVILMAFGIGAIAIGIQGRSEVRTDVSREAIVGSSDMTPTAIQTEIQNAKLKGVEAPSCSVAGQKIDTGAEAKCFASYMRIHTLLSTGGLTYSQMGRYVTPAGKPTDDAMKAAMVNGQPKENSLRNLWVTETALSTALNTSFFAEQVALFSIVMGTALLLTGIGFFILTLGGALGAFAVPRRKTQAESSGKLLSAGGRS